ncbi:MAG: hypothetical protein U0T68_12410 [Ferruginibacter sp.]
MIVFLSFLAGSTRAEVPDTVQVGIYITSIHDIDFKQKEYTTTFWVWFRYKRREFNFLENIEIPQAKTFSKSFSTIDSSRGDYYVLMKIQGVMKDSWKTENFPFDRQKLRFSIENSQFDNSSLVFMPDKSGKNYDPKFTLRGWAVDSCIKVVDTKIYETSFGDTQLEKPQSAYSAFKVRLAIHRNAGNLFWKLFLGMYVAWLIAFVCFFIHADSIDSRFGLSVGALFAVIGNKYIVDSALPETTTFTLVDILHELTLLFILLITSATAYSLKLNKNGLTAKARRFDLVTAITILLLYILANWYFISGAISG